MNTAVIPPEGRTRTNPHIFLLEGEAPGAPGLAASRCRDCRAYTLGSVPVCSSCLSRNVELVAAGHDGELREFSVAHHPADGFEAPYAIGLIETAEGIKLFAPLEGDPEAMRPGQPFRFLTVARPDGRIGFAYGRAGTE